MNYIVDQIEDHKYYHDLFIKNLNYVSEDKFINVWKDCNAKSINIIEKNSFVQIPLKEFILLSNFKTVLNNFLKEEVKIKKYQGWINRYKKGEFQESHNHHNKKFKSSEQSYSFVYFLNIPKNSFCFNFCDKDGRNKNYINEKSGDLLIFDPLCYHSVDKNNSEELRYTLAGNLTIE